MSLRKAAPKAILLLALAAGLAGCFGGGGGTPPPSSGPLEVSAVSPSPGAIDALWTKPATATFSKAINPSSLTTNSFRLLRGETPVSGRVSYNSSTRTASFLPDSPLRPNEQYTAILTSAIADTSGGHLTADYSWSFTTMPVTHQPLRVEGNRILDGENRQVIFRGVNAVDPASMDQYYHHWDEEYFEAMRSWGVTLVRIPVHNPAYKWYENREPGSYLRLLDWGVAWAAERGMYVVIDFHAIGYPPTGEWQQTEFEDPNWGQIYQFTPQDLHDFWAAVSAHYAGDNRIAFYDLFNEPAKDLPNGLDVSPGAWAAWRALAESLIDEIRANDRNRVVVVGGLQFAYDLSNVPTDPVNRDNVVYSTHVYPWSLMPGDWRKDWNGAFGNTATSKPVIAGEVGFDPQADPNSGMYGTVENFGVPLVDNYLEPRGIGWLAWNFSPEWPPTLLADWFYTPTVSGEFFRQRLLAQRGGWKAAQR
ncbi:MAG: cellulase family glycosylhydrolase [Bacillota bacterium]